jgi:hypothetical protein
MKVNSKNIKNTNVELATEEEILMVGVSKKDEMNIQSNQDIIKNPKDVVDKVVFEFGDKDYKKIVWWASVPKRDRLKTADIVYHSELDRFGIFIQPSKKEGLVRTRLFKLGSRTETYTRDWYLGFEDLVLVKRGDTVKREFIETEREYLKRAGKQIRNKDLVAHA